MWNYNRDKTNKEKQYDAQQYSPIEDRLQLHPSPTNLSLSNMILCNLQDKNKQQWQQTMYKMDD